MSELASEQPRAYSLEQLATAWGVSLAHLKNLVRSGQLPVFRVGRRVLVPLTVVEAVEAGEVEVR